MLFEQKIKHLREYYQNHLKDVHLSALLNSQARGQFSFWNQDLVYDYSHLKIDQQAIDMLIKLCQQLSVPSKIKAMFAGEITNFTQKRQVLHMELRNGTNQKVEAVLKKIQKFTSSLRAGQLKGVTGKPIRNMVSIGIGGSYLGAQFVYEALRSHPEYKALSAGLKLRFLANIDPIDFSRSIEGLDVQQTIFLVNSKTFTTAQTMLNAASCKQFAFKEFQKKGVTSQKQIISKHFCACSTSLKLTNDFGIDQNNVFQFWDWVGGRFSVCSSVGVVPLSFFFSFKTVLQFFRGCKKIDQMFLNQKDPKKNLPLLAGLLSVYNISVVNLNAVAIIPYCQALLRFVPHIQQLMMQSNGKFLNSKAQKFYETQAVIFGEPGTNSQHSFFQQLHHGRKAMVQFIGFCKSQCPYQVEGAAVNNHDELMSNFFSQPDALAVGVKLQQVIQKDQKIKIFKTFQGDRPSTSLLFNSELNAFNCGQLLALYQHRTAVEGFIWDINSFDQFGVELGKVLAKAVKQSFDGKPLKTNQPTLHLLKHYMKYK